MAALDPKASLFQVWVAACHDWRPTDWNETPPAAQALEPVVDRFLTWDEACPC